MEYKHIKDFCHINRQSLDSNYPYEMIEYVDTSSMTQNWIQGIQSFKVSEAPSRAKRMVGNNTIVYSSVRPNLKHFGILKNPARNLIVSTGFITLDIIDENEVLADYLYYYISQQYIVDYLHCIAENSVSAYPSINPSDLANLLVPIPSLREQDRICALLKCVDEKISVNRAINHNLPILGRSSGGVEARLVA